MAESGTAVADISKTGTCRTESDSEGTGTVTVKATFTCTATDADDLGDGGAKVSAKEEITLGGKRYAIDRLIGNGGEAEVYVVS